MNTSPSSPPPSDARYIFIFFALIFVVIFFTILIYFVYDQNQAEDLSIEQSNEIYIKKDDISFEKTQTTPVPEKKNEVPLAPVPLPINTNADVSAYNPRITESLMIHGRDFLLSYFDSIARGDYQYACSLLSNTLCNARRDIYSFSQFLSKTVDGYTVKNIALASEQKVNEAIYCVEYTYSLKADRNPIPVTEIFQYRIRQRPDGGDEISARVCEKIIKDGRERPCPIITPKKYCT